MSAIEFVVRNSVGAVQRGFVGGDAGSPLVLAQPGSDISLNVSRAAVTGYRQEGDVLRITLANGDVITIDDYFGADGRPVADLYLSTDGLLTKVDLAAGANGAQFANYVEQDVFGKWSPDDDLYFVGGGTQTVATPYAADDQVGMLAGGLPFLGGLGLPLLGLLGLGAGTAVLGGGGDRDDDDDEGPEVTITTGTETVGHIVDGEDQTDGATIGGTGTPGGTITVVIDGHTETTVVDETGNWTVTVPPTVVVPGDYKVPVVVTITDETGTSTVTDNVVVDTVVNVTFNAEATGGDGTVNAVEQAGSVILSGTVDAGSTVVVTVNGQTFTAVVTGTTWTCGLPAAYLPTGELPQSATVTATDSLGNTATVSGTFQIDTITAVTVNTAIVGGNGTVNAVEQSGAVTITGTAEAGSTVTVTVNGTAYTAVLTGTNWSLNLPAGVLPTGDLSQLVSVTSTDAAGNTASTSGSFEIDTVVNVGFNAAATGGNGTVSGAEQDGVVRLTGTVDAGSTVVVSIHGSTFNAVVTGTTWHLDLPPNFLPEGTLTQSATVTATDDQGNTNSTTGSFAIDTEVAVTFNAGATGGDGMVSGAEQDGVVRLSGTVDAGSTVVVTINGSTFNAVVTGTTWHVDLAAGFLPEGELSQSASVTATDEHGNTATTNGTFQLDTYVNRLEMDRPVEGDNLVNRAEALDGITLTGWVEVGSTVVVTFEGTSRAATVNANGSWSVSYTGAEVPPGEYTAEVTIHATDAVGNTREIDETFLVDTTPPDAPLITDVTRTRDTVRGLSTEANDETIALHAVAGNGNVSVVNYTQLPGATEQEVSYNFAGTPVPNGSHLVMTATDASGNATSTLFVLEEMGTSVVNVTNPGYDGFNIEAIDLQVAEDSVLTLTAADLESLAAHSNNLTIHGDADDTVNVAGAVDTGTNQMIGDRSYSVYSFGVNGGTLIIDDAITVNI